MVCCQRSATALTVAFLTGLPLKAWAEEAENSTMVASGGLRGSAAGVNCKVRKALCGSNGRQTAICCQGLKCEPWLGSFDMRCADKPTPAPTPPPARNTCREIGCGSQFRPGDACECSEECLLRGTCCSDFYSLCKRLPTPPPTPPAPAPTPSPIYMNYVVYTDKNAYAPYGAVDIDTDATAPTGLSVSACQYRCTVDPNCMCVTRERDNGKCWKRADCVPSQWTSDYNFGYNVYVKRNYSPSPTPPPPAPTPPPVTQGRYVKWSFDSSYCMSVDNNVFRNGQRMQLWDCAGGSGQMFQFDNVRSDVPSVLRASAATQYCVVIDGNKNENGAFAQLWECDLNEQAQHWTRQWVCASSVSQAGCARSDPQTRADRGDAMLMRNSAFPDKCLVVGTLFSTRGANGQTLQLWSCDSSVQQYQTWRHYDF